MKAAMEEAIVSFGLVCEWENLNDMDDESER